MEIKKTPKYFSGNILKLINVVFKEYTNQLEILNS